MTHPSSLDLEGYACGEALAPAALEHLMTCEACGAFVAQLKALVAPTEAEGDARAARALAAIEAEDERESATESGPAIVRDKVASAIVLPITQRARDADAPRAASPDRRKRLWVLATSVITPLAAAAAILILARTPRGPDGREASSPPTAAPVTVDTVQMGRLPPGMPHTDPDTTFKGGMQIAVVRERGNQQRRFSSVVQVKAGDRLRVEVALDHEQAILGAVLGDDGSYLELMPEGVRGAGTYFSERSARIDSSPTRGTIVIGTPQAVAVARATRQLDGVATLRVEWEAQP